MRAYGLNLLEYGLSVWLKRLSWVCLLYAIATMIFPNVFSTTPVYSFALFVCFLFLGIAGAGLRQNRAVLDLAVAVLFLTGAALLVSGIYHGYAARWIAGVVALAAVVVTVGMRRRALSVRFKPRFFSLRQFETMVSIADTMIEGDGAATMSPVQIAISVDEMFSGIDSPAAIKEIRLVFFLVEWLLPVMGGMPFPYSDVGTNERRRLVTRVIGSNRLFKNVAKVLKLFACAGYYGSPDGMSQVGYTRFSERERSRGVSKDPTIYPDPFLDLKNPLYGKI